MTGVELIFLVIYIVGCLIAWPIVARAFDNDVGCYDTTDYIMAILMGLCFAWAWPVLALVPLVFMLKWLFFPDTFKEDRVKERVTKFIKR